MNAERPQQLEFRWAAEAAPRPRPSPPPVSVEPDPAPPSFAPEATDVDTLRNDLAQHSGVKIEIRLTNNSATMISSRTARNGILHLRMHHMFLHAPPKVRRALGVWLRSRRAKKAAATIDEFIKAHKHLVREKKSRAVRLHTQGRFHDLAEIYHEVNARFFNGTIDARISWGRMPGRRPRRSIRFGSYSTEDHLIRLHPLLDQDFVPRYFVKYIVFHEMLHAFLGVEECENGRRAIHPPKFKRLETQYPEYERAIEWMNRPSNLRRILGSRKRRR